MHTPRARTTRAQTRRPREMGERAGRARGIATDTLFNWILNETMTNSGRVILCLPRQYMAFSLDHQADPADIHTGPFTHVALGALDPGFSACSACTHTGHS